MRKRQRSTVQPPSHDWYLKEWMQTLRISQARLSERTGWSKASTNSFYHCKNGYYREVLNEAADALHIQPFELLMHPEDAMAIRQMRADALRVVESSRRLSFAEDEAQPVVAERTAR